MRAGGIIQLEGGAAITFRSWRLKAIWQEFGSLEEIAAAEAKEIAEKARLPAAGLGVDATASLAACPA